MDRYYWDCLWRDKYREQCSYCLSVYCII